ncbi:MAG: pentapeptide repeat-containing protein, partial [Bryobacteraceae bacterium]
VDLSEVDLSEVDLSEVDLSEVDLSEVDLSEVDLSEVDLSEVGLSEVGLAEVEHGSRSNCRTANRRRGHLDGPSSAAACGGKEPVGSRPESGQTLPGR